MIVVQASYAAVHEEVRHNLIYFYHSNDWNTNTRRWGIDSADLTDDYRPGYTSISPDDDVVFSSITL